MKEQHVISCESPVSYILRIGRRICVQAHRIPDVPGGHLSGVIHAGVSQFICAHVIETIQDLVDVVLALFLLPDEIVGIGDVMARLVSMAVLADETGHVLHLVASPRFREKGIQFRFDRLLGRIQADDTLRVMRRVEQDVPGGALIGGTRVFSPASIKMVL